MCVLEEIQYANHQYLSLKISTNLCRRKKLYFFIYWWHISKLVAPVNIGRKGVH